jgi:hypothetical protein
VSSPDSADVKFEVICKEDKASMMVDVSVRNMRSKVTMELHKVPLFFATVRIYTKER